MVTVEILLKAYRLMRTAVEMTAIYEKNRAICPSNMYVEPVTVAPGASIVVATPIYNYDANATAKNLVELTGSAWENKTVGFLCAAGGASSYMSIMGLANSLMLDFRCLIIPRFVYAKGEDFSSKKEPTADLAKRITALAEASVKIRNG